MSYKSLWGEEYDSYEALAIKSNTEKVLSKIKASKTETKSTEKQLKSKRISIADRLVLINEHVNSALGMHKNEIQVITNEDVLASFISRAIDNGVLAYDTETNNSLDYLTCKIVGLCLYTPGLKAAYVPINHVDHVTGELLPNQISKEFCALQLQRLVDNNTKLIMHNGKFDYQVTKCYLSVELPIYWDSMVAARMINENDESASLKWQYKDKIDKNHPDYDIDKMFPGILYEYVSPETFALYAATDSLMTYKLYKWQEEQLSRPDEQGVLRLFMEVENPLIIPVAEMELRGIKYNKEYSDRLQQKYHSIIDDYDRRINEEISKLSDKIMAWRLTPEANHKEEKINKKGEKSIWSI